MNLNSLTLRAVHPARPRRGVLLMAIGAALALGCGLLALQLAPMLLHPGELIGGERFTGSAEQGQRLLALLAVLALGGAACAGLGLRRWRRGRGQANSGSSTAA